MPFLIWFLTFGLAFPALAAREKAMTCDIFAPLKITLIAAFSEPTRVIGANGDLPWKGQLEEDWKRFNRVVRNSMCLHGTTSFEGLLRAHAAGVETPLRDCFNVVLSSRDNYQPPIAATGIRWVHAKSLIEAFEICKRQAQPDNENVFVCGGPRLYNDSLPFAHRLDLTVVKQKFDGDAFFPEFDRSLFNEVPPVEWQGPSHNLVDPHSGLEYSFVTFERK